MHAYTRGLRIGGRGGAEVVWWSADRSVGEQGVLCMFLIQDIVWWSAGRPCPPLPHALSEGVAWGGSPARYPSRKLLAYAGGHALICCRVTQRSSIRSFGLPSEAANPDIGCR